MLEPECKCDRFGWGIHDLACAWKKWKDSSLIAKVPKVVTVCRELFAPGNKGIAILKDTAFFDTTTVHFDGDSIYYESGISCEQDVFAECADIHTDIIDYYLEGE